MSHRFSDRSLEETLEAFVAALRRCLADRLVSVLLHGSILFDDLAPGYGDLDFLVVVRDEITDEIGVQLIELRRRLREMRRDVFTSMLEGNFIPRAILDPSRTGRTVQWGTTEGRISTRNTLSSFDLRLIRERGLVIWGEDVREVIPDPSREGLVLEARSFLASMRRHARPGTLHSIDWLLTTARLLLWLGEGRLVSKTEAASWGASRASAEWRESLPRARDLRRNPAMVAEQSAKTWLCSLGPALDAAADELERTLPI